MKKFLYPVVLLLSIASLKTYAGGTEYKIRFAGGGNAYWTGAANKYAVVKKMNDSNWYIKQTTLVSNMITGFGKWWDHDVTASRACLLEKDGWEDSKSCIKGEGGLLELPKNSDIKDYSIEIKWNENGAEQYVRFRLTDENLD